MSDADLEEDNSFRMLQPPTVEAMEASVSAVEPNQHDEMDVVFKDLTYAVQKHGDSPMEEVLLGASARIPAYSMCALCGPPNDGGTDGVVDLLREHVPVLHCEVGGMLPANHKVVYVPQSCTLVQFDLVKDVMHFYANLSLPLNTSSDRKRAAIEDMLEMMELQHCYGWQSKMNPPGGANRHAVGNLTDSEQWRLMVAVNLLTGPTCLLLNEPTTGPLVSAALSHIRIIKNVGRKLRMMVISHIYEPRNDVLYEMDYLVMMAKGKVLYAGTPQDARPFFTKLRAPAYPAQNLCEFSQEYLSTVSIKDVHACIASLEARNGPVDPAGAMDASSYGKNECVITGFGRWLSEPPLRSPASTPYRVFVLLLRLMRAYMYIWSQSNIIERTIFMIASGVVTTILFWNVNKYDDHHTQNYMNLLFLITNLLQTYSAVSAFQTIPVRQWWFNEKSSLIYSRLDTFLALTLGEGFLGIIFGIGYYFCLWVFPIGIHERDSMSVSVQCLLHVLLSVQSLRAVALCVVMTCRDYHNTMAPMLCLYFVMAGTSGAFMSIQQMVYPMRLIAAANPMHYLYVGLYKSEWTGVRIVCADNVFVLDDCPTGDDLIRDAGFDHLSNTDIYGMHAILTLAYLTVSYVLLGFVNMQDTMEYNVLYGTPPLKMLYFLFSKRIPGKIMIVVAKLCNVGLSKSMENAPLLGPTQNLYSMVTYSTMDDVASLNVDPSKLPAVLEYSNIAYKVEERSGNTRDIFHRISFAVKQATLFAITGPSADDNQTLINILGHAKMPGTVYADRMPVLKEEMSFVPEAPELPVFETMFETLVFHAMCSMPANTTFKDQRYRADNVMRLMGLYYLRNCYIGGELSGGIVATGATIGMRRRVAIGCALMKSPHVVIMDQPTRGLSAFDQLEIMEVLKRLSNQGRTVICTINEERYNVVHMLDHIMFMHCGQVVYIGPPTKVIDAFSQATGIKPVGDENPADFGLDCLRGLVHENVVGLIMKMPPHDGPKSDGADVHPSMEDMTEADDLEANEFFIKPPLQRQAKSVNVVWLLFMRLARHVWRHPEITIFRLLWLVFTAVCIGLPFLTLDRTGHLDPKTLGARVGCILLYLVFGLAQSAMTITLVHQQRKLYMSEIRLGFYTASHIYFAFAQLALLFAFVGSLLCFGIVWALAGYREPLWGWHTWIGLGNGFVLFFIAEVLSILFGIAVEKENLAQQVYVGFIVSFLVPTSGLFVALKDVIPGIRAIFECTPMHFVAGTEVINQFKDRDLLLRPELQDQPRSLVQGDAVIYKLSLNTMTGSVYWNTLVVIGQALLIMLCTYLLMDMIVARRVAEKYVRRGPRAAGALRELLNRNRKEGLKAAT